MRPSGRPCWPRFRVSKKGGCHEADSAGPVAGAHQWLAGDCAFGLLPLECSEAGPVNRSHDLLYAGAVQVVGERAITVTPKPKRKSPKRKAAGKKAARTAKVNKAVKAVKKVAKKAAKAARKAAPKKGARKAAKKGSARKAAKKGGARKAAKKAAPRKAAKKGARKAAKRGRK